MVISISSILPSPSGLSNSLVMPLADRSSTRRCARRSTQAGPCGAAPGSLRDGWTAYLSRGSKPGERVLTIQDLIASGKMAPAGQRRLEGALAPTTTGAELEEATRRFYAGREEFRQPTLARAGIADEQQPAVAGESDDGAFDDRHVAKELRLNGAVELVRRRCAKNEDASHARRQLPGERPGGIVDRPQVSQLVGILHFRRLAQQLAVAGAFALGSSLFALRFLAGHRFVLEIMPTVS